MNVLLIVATVLCVLAFILQVLCVALPHWFSMETSTRDVYYGLWEYCASVNSDNYVCRTYEQADLSVPDWLSATGAMMVLCLILILVALVIGCLAFCYKYTILLYIIAGILALFAALCGFVGLVVFGAKFDDDYPLDGDDLHASFYLAIFASLFALIAGILYILSKPKSTVKSFEKF